MAMTSVNIRMDADIKRQAEELFNELGLNMSTAMNMFVRQAIQHQGIPFDIVISPKNQAVLALRRDIESQLKDPNAKQYHSAEELHADILAEDNKDVLA